MNPKAYRLPAHALPRRYDVSLSARLASDDFSGRVRIALDLVERRETIELHARDLALGEARVTIGWLKLRFSGRSVTVNARSSVPPCSSSPADQWIGTWRSATVLACGPTTNSRLTTCLKPLGPISLSWGFIATPDGRGLAAKVRCL